MNREILYRAKRTNTGEWIEGYYSEIKLTSTPYILTGEIAIEPCKKGIVQFECYEVWPDTVCQYTGLKDKNGRKIFEGDIVRYANIGALGKVVWYEGDYIGYAIDDIEDSFQQYDKELFEKTEVIGNIFDNPELLRGA